MAVFDANDIVEAAVRIEENGANFYRYAVQLAATEEVKTLFQMLAAQEVKHQETFAKILAGMDRNAPRRDTTGNMPPTSTATWTTASSSRRRRLPPNWRISGTRHPPSISRSSGSWIRFTTTGRCGNCCRQIGGTRSKGSSTKRRNIS